MKPESNPGAHSYCQDHVPLGPEGQWTPLLEGPHHLWMPLLPQAQASDVRPLRTTAPVPRSLSSSYGQHSTPHSTACLNRCGTAQMPQPPGRHGTMKTLASRVDRAPQPSHLCVLGYALQVLSWPGGTSRLRCLLGPPLLPLPQLSGPYPPAAVQRHCLRSH